MKTIIDHLKDRHLDLEIHRPVINEEEHTATFFLFNLSGQIVGYQQYRPHAGKFRKNDPKSGRYYTYRSATTHAIFGLESFNLSPSKLFVTEGIFDAARVTSRGFSAVAVLSNDPPKDLRNFLFSIGRKIIVVCDSDTAGRKLAKFGHTAVFTREKDLGDSSEEFVNHLVKNF